MNSSELAEAVFSNDYFRRPPLRPGDHARHKEWLHFAIHVDGIDALANFSLVDDVRPGVRAGAQLARVVVLVRDGQWDGDIDQYDTEVEVCGGRFDIRMGDNVARRQGDQIELRVKLRHRPVEMELVLSPQVMPNQANTEYVAGCPTIHWLCVPRLSASGRMVIGGKQIAVNEAPAYHDHNWGSWRWGQNFAWEWGYGIPNDSKSPWSLVFVRLTDRGRLTALTQSLFVWKGPRQHRFFRADEVTVESEGLLRPESLFKLPHVMGLISQGRITDIPKRLRITARGTQDWLEATFTSESVAQVILPNDDDLGVTIINEVSGSIKAVGLIQGESVNLGGPTIFEFLSD